MKKRKVIIDCDPGIDDSLAIMLALKSPESSGCSCVHWGKHSLKAGLRECSGYSRRRRAWRELSA